jgi:hypothetical protein
MEIGKTAWREMPGGLCNQLSSGVALPNRGRIVQCRRISRILALPREARQSNGFNGLRNFLSKKRLVVFQGISEGPPKRARGEVLIHCK